MPFSFFFTFCFLTSTCAGLLPQRQNNNRRFRFGREFGLVRSYISGLNTHADEILGKLS